MSAVDVAGGLASWLSQQWGETITVENLAASSAGARRSNVLFTARRADGSARGLVATILPTAAIQILSVAEEAEVRSLAEAAGVPAPHVHGVCLDPDVAGGPFFVSDLVEGETIPRRVLRLVERAGNGEAVAAGIGHALARLHGVDVASAPAVLRRPAPGTGPIAATLETLRTSMDELLQPEPALAYGLRWLEANRPAEPARLSVVHNDCRNGNLIVGPDGLRALLDWEACSIGDPMSDVAWPCLRMWRFHEDAKTVGGFAGVEPYRAAYEAAGGTWDEERFRWWRVQGTLRWGLGLAGQVAQHLDGRFRSIVMAGSGRRVTELAYDLLLLTRPT